MSLHNKYVECIWLKVMARYIYVIIHAQKHFVCSISSNRMYYIDGFRRICLDQLDKWKHG